MIQAYYENNLIHTRIAYHPYLAEIEGSSLNKPIFLNESAMVEVVLAHFHRKIDALNLQEV